MVTDPAAPQEDAPLPLIERLREFKRVYRRPTADFGHDDACIDAAIAALAEKDALIQRAKAHITRLADDVDDLHVRLANEAEALAEKDAALKAERKRGDMLWQECENLRLQAAEKGAALRWYAEKAEALARYANAEPPKAQAMMAVVAELTLDAGKRAALGSGKGATK